MADHTLYDTTEASEGSLALAHQKILRLKVAGVFINVTGDINNLALNPTKLTVPREVYGKKGRPSSETIGYSFAPSFAVEGIRDPITKQIVASQAWVIDLLNAAFAVGADNKREFQIFDALDPRLPAFEGTFNVAVADLNTGYADKAGWTFTLESDGEVPQIASPIAGDGTAILESASPAGQAPGDLIVVRGYNLDTFVSATIDGISVVESRIVDRNAVVLLIPAAVAGSAPIVVTTTAGVSAALPYAAA